MNIKSILSCGIFIGLVLLLISASPFLSNKISFDFIKIGGILAIGSALLYLIQNLIEAIIKHKYNLKKKRGKRK